VNAERVSHRQKQYSQSFSTEGGIQIDDSDEQLRNASSSIQKSLEPRSKITQSRVEQSAKQRQVKVSTVFGIVTSDTFPKYLLSEMPSKSTRRRPMILK
jgi:hypothetical protein